MNKKIPNLSPEFTICPHCRLAQFLTATCRRCSRQLGVACVAIPLPPREILFGLSGDQWLREHLGNLLAEMRRDGGYSQTGFASAVAVGESQRSHSHISRIERGHILPSISLLVRAAVLVGGIDRIYVQVREPDQSKPSSLTIAGRMVPTQIKPAR